jgi:hypothetical protein
MKMSQTGRIIKPQTDNKHQPQRFTKQAVSAEKLTLRDVSYAQRRKEAQEPLYLVRYE